MTLGTLLGGLFSYGFSLAMGRLLGPEMFGDIGAASSVIMVIGSLGTALLLVAMHFGGSLIAQGRADLAQVLHGQLIRRVIQATVIIVLLMLLLIGPLSELLSIKSRLAFGLIIASLIFAMPLFVSRGFLQGAKSFRRFSWTNVIELGVKFTVSIILVKIGLSINGAAAAFVISSLVAYWFAEASLKPVWASSDPSFRENGALSTKEVLAYAWPAALSSGLNLVVINLDILLAKAFFSPLVAGQYVAISTVAKIIFYITGPISSVMFPLITEQWVQGVKHYKTLFLALGATAVTSAILLGLYYLFQRPIIAALYGAQYVELSGLLFGSAVIVVSLSFTNLMSTYFLSVKKFGFLYLLAVGVALELVIVGNRHQTIEEMVGALQVGSSLLITLMMVYYLLMKRGVIVSRLKGNRG